MRKGGVDGPEFLCESVRILVQVLMQLKGTREFTISTPWARHTVIAFGRTLKEADILGSMATAGDVLDDAAAESLCCSP